jgi:CheY-like chemotaxis protein
MRVLLVEDDENKRQHLVSFLGEIVPGAEIETAESYSSGVRAIVDGRRLPDLIILDMSLPAFDISASEHGGGSEVYGGREILEQMNYRGIAVPVIVVTQFDRFGENNSVTLKQLDEQLASEYGENYRGAVFYNSGREGWRPKLKRLMSERR